MPNLMEEVFNIKVLIDGTCSTNGCLSLAMEVAEVPPFLIEQTKQFSERRIEKC